MAMQYLLQCCIWFLFAYVIVHALAQIGISLLTYGIIRRDMQFRRVEVDEFLLTGLEPPISVVIPAYNEEATIVTSVRSMLQLRYAEHEIIVVNDGSRDGTLQRLVQAFDLETFPQAYHLRLPTQPVRAVYRSASHPSLRVLDKDNGGKADAINCGINAARYPLFCCVDADSILDRDSHSHAAAHTQRGQPLSLSSALKLMQQRHHDPRAAAANRMAKRDRAAVDIHFLRGDRHILQHREDLRGKRLVDLDEIEVADREAGPVAQLRNRRHRADAHDPWINARAAPSDNAGERLQPAGLGVIRAGEHERRSTIGDA